MADELVKMTIGFKNAPHNPHEREYRITQAELDRLTGRFNDGTQRDVVDVVDDSGKPRRLFLIFSEIVFIG